MGGIVQSTVFGIPRGAQDSQKLRSHAQSVGTIQNYKGHFWNCEDSMSLTGYSEEMRLSITLMSCFCKPTDHEKQNSFIYCPRNLHLGCVPTRERGNDKKGAGCTAAARRPAWR